ncbi:IniB N-terminal domain-containing protein [Microbacterium terricola]|uniref:Uncharacterized protein n=1 Tax=Microbacterium terricola TaxID=344163 RepID=A0ABM8E1V9_9MICO|nr:IniB N-terminal domain-containing protein [Microbacterium terricola]UYK40352.1 IniB N-terminal domain-containing protein [Microbacterium terricola]BDV31934.1 hypothetical protein Microterr_25940 [Microbacterium terricola]
MSLTLATVADALIEFILSLLRDPDAQAEFDADPEGALAARGLQHAGPSDVAAVAPIIIERTHVVQVGVPQPVYFEREHQSAIVREINQVTSHFQWVDDRDTVVDQSVNQNIWADGDVTQTFDNDAIVASGDEAVAAGNDATVDKTWDESTTIEAGDDVNMGNETDVQVVEDSMNEETDASTTTDDSTVVVVDDSFDEQTGQVDADDSFNDTETVTETADTTIVTDTGTDTAAADPATVETETETVEPETADADVQYEDAATQYVETDLAEDSGGAFSDVEPVIIDESADDDNF